MRHPRAADRRREARQPLATDEQIEIAVRTLGDGVVEPAREDDALDGRDDDVRGTRDLAHLAQCAHGERVDEQLPEARGRPSSADRLSIDGAVSRRPSARGRSGSRDARAPRRPWRRAERRRRAARVSAAASAAGSRGSTFRPVTPSSFTASTPDWSRDVTSGFPEQHALEEDDAEVLRARYRRQHEHGARLEVGVELRLRHRAHERDARRRARARAIAASASERSGPSPTTTSWASTSRMASMSVATPL